MAFTQLKTDYVNDSLNTGVNTNVRYTMTDNGDGTVSLTDATAYSVMGDSFDAGVINGIDTVVNSIGAQVTTNVSDISTNATNIATNTTNIAKLLAGKVDLDTTAAAGTTDGDLYAAIVALGWEAEVIE